MYYFFSESNDPVFNLACEEYLLKNFDDDFFILYINQPSLIVGKHQNTLAEINLSEVQKQNIQVVRRLSGGGTVFHDFGNLNYCFIKKGEKGKLVDFKKYTSPIIKALQKLGVDAKFEGKSDLTIDGKKFSGNASHVYKNKIMQHGTMLFSSNLERLNQLLKVNPLKFNDRGIRSIRSRVTNISEHLPTPISIHDFAKSILDEVQQIYPNSLPFSPTVIDKDIIEQLVLDKYGNWEWNYAYSPNYSFSKTCNYSNGNILEVSLQVRKGVISSFEIYGNCLVPNKENELQEKFINQKHTLNTINQLIDKLELNFYFKYITKNNLVELLF